MPWRTRRRKLRNENENALSYGPPGENNRSARAVFVFCDQIPRRAITREGPDRDTRPHPKHPFRPNLATKVIISSEKDRITHFNGPFVSMKDDIIQSVPRWIAGAGCLPPEAILGTPTTT